MGAELGAPAMTERRKMEARSKVQARLQHMQYHFLIDQAILHDVVAFPSRVHRVYSHLIRHVNYHMYLRFFIISE